MSKNKKRNTAPKPATSKPDKQAVSSNKQTTQNVTETIKTETPAENPAEVKNTAAEMVLDEKTAAAENTEVEKNEADITVEAENTAVEIIAAETENSGDVITNESEEASGAVQKPEPKKADAAVKVKKPKAPKKEKAVKEKAVKEKADKPKAFDYEKSVEPSVPAGKNIKQHLLSVNPVFVKALAIIPVLGAGFSLKNGILLSAAMLVAVILLNAVMYPLNRVIPRSFRNTITFLISALIITPVCMAANQFTPDVLSSCSIYLPLLAFCAVPMVIKKHYGSKKGFLRTMFDALLEGVGFAVAAVVFSALREIIGSGTLYDRALPNFVQMKFNFLLVPAGAFILLGLFMALFRKIFGKDSGEDYNK